MAVEKFEWVFLGTGLFCGDLGTKNQVYKRSNNWEVVNCGEYI